MLDVLNPLLASMTSFVFAFLLLPFVIRFSRKRGIGARPGKRRIHKTVTPTLGGVAIFFGFTVSSICHNSPQSQIFVLLTILVIPFIIGFFDDLFQLTPKAKLIAQWITGTLVYTALSVKVTSSYGLFGYHEFHPTISYLITIVTVIIITNSLNLIDGIDGLAAAVSFIAICSFGLWFFFTGNESYSTISFALAGALLAFLMKNWQPSEIFMGDTGSLVIGTLLSIIAIEFISENMLLPTGSPWKTTAAVGTAVAVLVVPLWDTSRVIIIRLSKRLSPFRADKRHIHHALLRLNLTHRQVVCGLAVVQILFIVLAVSMRNAGDWQFLALIFAITLIFSLILDLLARQIPASKHINKY